MPVAPVTEDTEAKAFAPPPGKAGVYIARNSILAYGVLFQIIVDGKMVGGIAKDTYHWLAVEPGEHSVVVMSRENQDMVEFTAEEGQNYFYIVEPGMGWGSARANIKPLEEGEGQKVVEGCKLARGMK